MEVLRGTAIPALLVLLLTSVGWLLDRSITRLGAINFIEYETRVEDSADGRIFWVDIRNASLAGTIDDLTVLIACDANPDCFAPSPGGRSFLNQTLYEVAPKKTSGLSEDSNAAQITLSLIAGSRVTLSVTTNSKKEVPKLTFYPNSEVMGQYSISRGISYSSYIARNYTNILLLSLLSVLSLCFIYIILLVRSKPKAKEPENEDNNGHINIDLHINDLRHPDTRG